MVMSDVDHFANVLRWIAVKWLKWLNKNTQYELARDLRQVGCDDQDMLTEYIHYAVKYHREFRNLYNAFSADYLNTNGVADLSSHANDPIFANNFNKLYDAYRRLDYFLNDKFIEAVDYHCKSAQNLFKNTLGRKHLPEPRCGIKIIEGDNEGNAKVVSLWGTYGYGERNEKRTSALRENTAGEAVFKEPRKGCLVNDIPSAVRAGDYVNKRIDRWKAVNYAKWWRPCCSGWLVKPEKAWVDCWIPDNNIDGEKVEPKTTYKSTLVIPITVNLGKIREVEREIKDSLQRVKAFPMEIGHKIPSYQLFFGYFNVDTHITNYFDERLDNEIGYYIADLLYFYFYIYYLHSRLSPAYRDYWDLIQKNKNFLETLYKEQEIITGGNGDSTEG
jgi:hypothetical protein